MLLTYYLILYCKAKYSNYKQKAYYALVIVVYLSYVNYKLIYTYISNSYFLWSATISPNTQHEVRCSTLPD